MDTLKPPSYSHPTTNQQNNKTDKIDLLLAAGSPPRSNSIDLSTLKREIELWSISSADNSDLGSETDYDLITQNLIDSDNSESNSRTIRSKSHDPSQSPEHFLRRHSRIEHLSEIFRY